MVYPPYLEHGGEAQGAAENNQILFLGVYDIQICIQNLLLCTIY